MKGSVSILDFKIRGYSDDPDILAKAQLNIDGQDYEVLVVAAAAPATTKKYIPDVIDLEQEGDLKRMLVVFNGDRLSEELDRAITQAKAELDELDDEDNSCVCSHFVCPDPECHTEVEVLYYEKPF